MFSQGASEWGMAQRAVKTQGNCGKEGSSGLTATETACCYASGALSPRSRCAARRQLELARMRQPRLTAQEAKLLHSRVVHELLSNSHPTLSTIVPHLSVAARKNITAMPQPGKAMLPAVSPCPRSSNSAQPVASVSPRQPLRRCSMSTNMSTGPQLPQKTAAIHHLTPLPRFTSAAQEKRVQAWCAESLSANTLSLSHSLDLGIAEDELMSRPDNESAPSMTLSWSCLTAHTPLQ